MTRGRTMSRYLFSWPPTPSIVGGALLGFTVGAYTIGPIAALAGIVVGGIVGAGYERFVDATAPMFTRPKPDAHPDPARRP